MVPLSPTITSCSELPRIVSPPSADAVGRRTADEVVLAGVAVDHVAVVRAVVVQAPVESSFTRCRS